MTPRTDYSIDQLEMRLAPDEIIVDSFAGGGGASLGIQWALGHGPHIAINHDQEAIALNAPNQHKTGTNQEDVWHVDPVQACRGRKVGLMWLSPDCKHFSKAKGGKPVSKKIRGLAWTAVRWAKAVRPRVIVLENVEEFQGWGPVLKTTNKPDPARKGHTFKRFVRRLERLGYVVEWRELRACDYGAPTIRKRLFLIARCDGQPIAWPAPTHGKGRALAWRTAAECIDWSILCPSIFERKKALADNTLRRIARGIKRYVIDSPKPFIVSYYGPKGEQGESEHRTADVHAPLPTVTTEKRFGLVTPIIAGVGGRAGQSPERSLQQPLQTITAKADSAIVIPTIINTANGKTTGRGPNVWPLDESLRTITQAPGFAISAPLLVPMQHQNRATSVDEPMQTVTTQGNKFNLVAPLLVPTTHEGDARAHSIDEPTRTITGAHRGEHALIAPFLKPRYGEDPDPTRRGGLGQAPRSRSLEEPMPVVVPTGNGGDLVATFLAKHYGGHETPGASLADPASTITTQDHHHLVATHLARFNGDRIGGEIDAPIGTVIASTAKHALVASSLINLRGTRDDQIGGRSIDEPLPTISGGGIHAAEVRAFLISYYGTDQASGELSSPAPTVTPRDRFGLVTVEGVEYQIADIGMRMLAPRELYRAQGFPDTYRIDVEFNGKPMTKTAQVRMCGNSVCPPLAAAIIRANLMGATFAPQRERVA